MNLKITNKILLSTLILFLIYSIYSKNIFIIILTIVNLILLFVNKES